VKSQCSLCSVKVKICVAEEGQGPAFCPTLNAEEALAEALVEYQKPHVREFARQASLQEAECYLNRDQKPYVSQPSKPRIQEICEFAHKMKYHRLGIGFCSGLAEEARAATRIFEAQGFEVVSVVCKAGRTPKEELGLNQDEKIRIGEFEAMCSPIFQAMLLNREETDFNVLIGLCVGHDSLFIKYCEAPVTVLVAKDRVTGHAPAVPLYQSSSYYRRLLVKGFGEPSGD